MWLPNSSDFNPVNYAVRDILQQMAYQLTIHDSQPAEAGDRR